MGKVTVSDSSVSSSEACSVAASITARKPCTNRTKEEFNESRSDIDWHPEEDTAVLHRSTTIRREIYTVLGERRPTRTMYKMRL